MARDTPQRQGLRAAWPATLQALEETYFPDPNWAMTTTPGRNQAGYILAALNNIQPLCQRILFLMPHGSDVLDRTFAAETRYHFKRGRVFRDPAKALPRCWHNLAKERPWRFDGQPHPPQPGAGAAGKPTS